jgi:hypothetical protein
MKTAIAAIVVIALFAAAWLFRRKDPAPPAVDSASKARSAESAPRRQIGGHTVPANAPPLVPSPPAAPVGTAAVPATTHDLLPRRLADVELPPSVEKALRTKEAQYKWPRQYRATLDVKLEVFARMAECLGEQVTQGQADIKLRFEPDAEHRRLIVTSAELQGTSLPTHDAFMLARYCVRVGMLGLEEPIREPDLATAPSVMYVDVHFPVASNPLFELLRSGEEPEIEDLTAAQYQQR